jgi:hypothetical protein
MKSSKEKLLNIDNLNFENIDLPHREDKPVKSKKKLEERRNKYFSPESGVMEGKNAASSDYLRFRPAEDHITNQ